MRNLTQCLARVVYELDLDNLPLKQLAEDTHRPRTRTTGSAGEWMKKKSFTEYRPPLPTSSSSMSSDRLTSAAVGRVLSKASTIEIHSTHSTPLSVPAAEKRRSSSPAVPRPSDSSTSVPLTKRELVHTEEKHLTILETGGEREEEEEEEGDEDTLPIVPSQNELLPIVESDEEVVTGEDNAVIANTHIMSPEPSEHIVSINIVTPTGSKSIIKSDVLTDDLSPSPTAPLVISNDDVSSDSGPTSDTISDLLPPTLLRRSLSDGSSMNRVSRQVAIDGRRSQSPDSKITFSYNSSSSFAQYLPDHQQQETTPTQTTPIIWSPSSDKTSSPLAEGN